MSPEHQNLSRLKIARQQTDASLPAHSINIGLERRADEEQRNRKLNPAHTLVAVSLASLFLDPTIKLNIGRNNGKGTAGFRRSRPGSLCVPLFLFDDSNRNIKLDELQGGRSLGMSCAFLVACHLPHDRGDHGSPSIYFQPGVFNPVGYRDQRFFDEGLQFHSGRNLAYLNASTSESCGLLCTEV
jgi:hypothetical protein